MTAIPEPTEEDLEFLKIIERQYAIASVLGGGESAKLIRLLSHYQRENERLARELEKYKSHSLQTALRNCSPGQFMDYVTKVAQAKGSSK